MSENYKVVKIISDSEIVVNVGSNNLITRGQTLEIFDPGDEVTDPETGKSLGSLDYIKTYLRVKHVYPQMCICENAETEPMLSDLLSAASGFFAAANGSKAKLLHVDPTDISGGLHKNRKIHIGDLVRKSSK